jgi:hypothetical protein
VRLTSSSIADHVERGRLIRHFRFSFDESGEEVWLD